MIRAEISAESEPLRQPSSTITARRVLATEAMIVASSSGRRLRRSITSALDALRSQRLGRLQRLEERSAIGDQADIAALAPHRRAVMSTGARRSRRSAPVML
jgi:hypothetical protein